MQCGENEMKKKKIVSIGLLAALSVTLLGACGRQQNSAGSSLPDSSGPAEQIVQDTHPGQERSPLTGQWISAKLAGQRPVALMISNEIGGYPHYGLRAADLIYEAPMEGDETRYMLVMQNYKKADKLMPCRSARHYFIYWAQEQDAIYAHYGQSWIAKPKLKAIDDLNGMDGDLANVTYFRDSTRRAPHNAYTNGRALAAGIQKRKYRTAHKSGFRNGLRFHTDDAKPMELTEGKSAKIVDPGYYRGKGYFVYDASRKVYRHYDWGERHRDTNSGKQLEVTNIIIQSCKWSVLDKTHEYLDVVNTGSGKGYYITRGRYEAITWKKSGKTGPTRYYDSKGKEITLNQGKTWICAVKTDYMKRTGFYKNKEAFEKARAKRNA